MIQKKIHYCWYGKKELPGQVKRCIASWEETLHDYEIICWNESNSPLDHPFVAKSLNAGRYAFASDYVRLWALYHHGGIYLDTDMLVFRSLDPFLDNQVFFGYEKSGSELISAGIIGSTKNNSFIKFLVDHYDSLNFAESEMENLLIPLIITKQYSDWHNKLEVRLYPYDYFYPLPYEARNEKVAVDFYNTSNTYAVHLWSKSWWSKRDAIGHFISVCTKYIIKKTKSFFKSI
jgi:mannosyltransferase OCH1-like enzyme